MTKLKTVRGSGNVFRDLGRKDADLHQLKALLAAETMRTLDELNLTVRKAHALTRIAAADFSHIRNADLGRFTVDRLLTILSRMGRDVDVVVSVRKRKGVGVGQSVSA